MTVDLAQVARDLTNAHRDRLLAGKPVTVASILLDAGRCPTCAAPLIRGETIAYCPACGTEIRDAA